MVFDSSLACVEFDQLFLHPLLDDPGRLSKAQAVQQSRLEQRASQLCANCPLLKDCLYRAVVDHDVNGFVAGTTAEQRVTLREMLDVSVSAEDFSRLAGLPTKPSKMDPHEIVQFRNQNAHLSLAEVAERLGFSLSSLKRQLKKARNTEPNSQPKKKPSADEVLAGLQMMMAANEPNRAA